MVYTCRAQTCTHVSYAISPLVSIFLPVGVAMTCHVNRYYTEGYGDVIRLAKVPVQAQQKCLVPNLESSRAESLDPSGMLGWP
jgi:hypothetical protein